MNECAGAWLSKAQARLATALVKEKTKFAPTVVDSAQAAWVAYRNAECRMQASVYTGGSIYPLIYLICEEGLTDTRTLEVQAATANVPH
jgi:uncharacterized protein YecT (DUF1311 family)